jgi:hypothetical protein
MGTKIPPNSLKKIEHGVLIAIFVEVSLKNCFRTFFVLLLLLLLWLLVRFIKKL